MEQPSKALAREVLLSFWKVHVLHHAAEGPIHGQWITDELRRHGYSISPGTLYPLLNRLEKHGWLRSERPAHAGPKARKSYRLTGAGRKTLQFLRRRIKELHDEVAAS